jgi:hypothetical protein
MTYDQTKLRVLFSCQAKDCKYNTHYKSDNYVKPKLCDLALNGKIPEIDSFGSCSEYVIGDKK